VKSNKCSIFLNLLQRSKTCQQRVKQGDHLFENILMTWDFGKVLRKYSLSWMFPQKYLLAQNFVWQFSLIIIFFFATTQFRQNIQILRNFTFREIEKVLSFQPSFSVTWLLTNSGGDVYWIEAVDDLGGLSLWLISCTRHTLTRGGQVNKCILARIYVPVCGVTWSPSTLGVGGEGGHTEKQKSR
jgi:hypothetical protein